MTKMNEIEELRDSILMEMNYWEPSWLPTPGESGTVNGLISRALRGLVPKTGAREQARRRLLAFLFGSYLNKKELSVSSSQLSSECWYALVQWVRPYKDDIEGWVSGNPSFETETQKMYQFIEAEFKRKEQEVLREMGFG